MRAYLLALEHELPGGVYLRAVLGSMHLRADGRGWNLVGMWHLHLVVLLLESLKLLDVVHLIYICSRIVASRHVQAHGLSAVVAHGLSARLLGIGMPERQPAHRRVNTGLPMFESGKMEVGVEVEKL